MTTEKIRQAHEARPFRPFSVRTGDGREFYVEHPEFMARVPTGRTIVVTDRHGSVNVIDLLLVTSLDLNPPRKTNGRRPRTRR